MSDIQKYLDILDNILKKINQSTINQFEVNDGNFYLKIKIDRLKKENNLKNKTITKNGIKNEITSDTYNKNNKENKLGNFKEKIEDGYKLVFYQENNENFVDVISTLVGKFYFTNNKEITKGSIIKANTILGYIEILNISYYIKFDFDVKIIEDYTKDLPFVQYSSKLFKLKIL